MNLKTNIDRSNANEYYVEHPCKRCSRNSYKICAVVNKSTAVINRFNDMNEEEMKEFEEFKKEVLSTIISHKKNKMQENSSSSEQQEVHNSVI